MKKRFIIGLLIVIIATEAGESGVEIVDAKSLAKLIAEKQKLLLFFADKDCLKCLECSNIYALVNE